MPSGRSNFAQTAIARTSTAAALALLALVLAYWTWAWLAPAPLLPAAEISMPAGRLAAAVDLFGRPQGEAHAATPTGLAVKLLGVMAGAPEGSGYALLETDAGKTRLVRAGADLAPGIRVEKVLPQQVILQRNGSRETLAWPHPSQIPAATANKAVK